MTLPGPCRGLQLLLFCLLLPTISACSQRAGYRALYRAERLEQAGRPEAALEQYLVALSELTEDAYVRRAVALAYSRRKAFDEATRHLEAAIRIEPTFIEAFRDLAALARHRKSPEEAAGWLERAVALVPDHAPLQEDLVELYMETNRLDRAMEQLESVIERWPDSVWAHFRLGLLYAELERYELAASSLELATQGDPDFAAAVAALGNIYYEQNRFDEAIAAFKRAIELNRGDHSSLNNLAWVYAQRGSNMEEALRLSRRSLRLRPDTPQYLDTLAEIHFRTGEREKAIELIEYALALNPPSDDLRRHLRDQLQRFQTTRIGKV